jgi:hypothetical protein
MRHVNAPESILNAPRIHLISARKPDGNKASLPALRSRIGEYSVEDEWKIFYATPKPGLWMISLDGRSKESAERASSRAAVQNTDEKSFECR